MRRFVCIAVVAAIATVPLIGRAEPEVQLAAAPRVFQAPTAWLQPRDAVFATAGIDHHGAPFAAVSAGLGGVAELDVTAGDLDGIMRPTALFKTGLRLGSRGAVCLGFRKSFGGDGRTAQAYAAASVDLGQVRLHGGIERWDAETPAGAPVEGFRPLAGLEWTPAIYPRSTVLADVVWAPRPDGDVLAWVGSAGVRYTPLSWGSIELGVQIREHDLLDRPSIFVRLNSRLAK